MGISDFIKIEPVTSQSGMIHECGMASRYQKIFTPEERAAIESRQGEFPFSQGQYFATRPDDYDVLVDLMHFSAHFEGSVDEQYINVRLQSLGIQYLIAVSDWRRFHNLMQSLIPTAYGLREQRKFALPFTKRLCKRHIEYTPMILAAASHIKELPAHCGYEYYMRMLEDHGRFPRALQCCEQAQREGWQGEWAGHIERLKHKLEGQVEAPPEPVSGSRIGKKHDSLLRVRCPGCNKRMKVPQNYNKVIAHCVQCGAQFNIVETKFDD